MLALGLPMRNPTPSWRRSRRGSVPRDNRCRNVASADIRCSEMVLGGFFQPHGEVHLSPGEGLVSFDLDPKFVERHPKNETNTPSTSLAS